MIDKAAAIHSWHYLTNKVAKALKFAFPSFPTLPHKPNSTKIQKPSTKKAEAHRIRRWTGLRPSRTSGKARPTSTDMA